MLKHLSEMKEKEHNINDILQAAEQNIRVPLPVHLKKVKKKPKIKTQFRYSSSTFYNTNFAVSKPYSKVMHMPFKNSYSND